MNLVELVVGSAAMLALLLGVVGVCIGISIGAVVERRTRFAVLTSSWDCPSRTCWRRYVRRCSPGS